MENQVEELLERSADATRRRDAGVLAQLMHPNANQGPAGGEPIVGREAIAAQLAPLLATVPDDIEQEKIARQIHFVTPNLAIVDEVVANVRVASGERTTVSTEAFTIVVIRDSGEWLVAAVRGAFPPRS